MESCNLMNIKIIASIDNSVKHIFSKMCMVHFEKSDESIENIKFAYCGIVGFSGQLTGNIALSLSDETAKHLVTRLVGYEVDEISDIVDGVSEFVNMVAGNTKAEFMELDISLSLPEIIRGENIQLNFRRYSKKEKILYSSEIGNLLLSFAYKMDTID